MSFVAAAPSRHQRYVRISAPSRGWPQLISNQRRGCWGLARSARPVSAHERGPRPGPPLREAGSSASLHPGAAPRVGASPMRLTEDFFVPQERAIPSISWVGIFGMVPRETPREAARLSLSRGQAPIGPDEDSPAPDGRAGQPGLRLNRQPPNALAGRREHGVHHRDRAGRQPRLAGAGGRHFARDEVDFDHRPRRCRSIS